MEGVVFVCPTPFYAHVGMDGRYQMANLPDGKFAIKTWQRRRRFPEQQKHLQLRPPEPAVVDWEHKRN